MHSNNKRCTADFILYYCTQCIGYRRDSLLLRTSNYRALCMLRSTYLTYIVCVEGVGKYDVRIKDMTGHKTGQLGFAVVGGRCRAGLQTCVDRPN